MIRFLTSLVSRGQPNLSRASHVLYTGVVAQARQPFFYETLSVADTPEGRLEMVMFHLALVCERLQRSHMIDLERALLETFVRDMDRTVRQMGFGDTGVAKRVKHLAGMLHHRLHHYREAWQKEKAPETIYALCAGGAEAGGNASICRAFADYAASQRAKLIANHDEALRGGALEWGPLTLDPVIIP